jgi:D-serine deaminase-like pyridoxal phosphate-dependent protein
MSPNQLLDSNLETPFLWAGLDIMERNVSCLAKYFKQAGVNWCPHIKGIKIPDIAKAAIGIICAKLSEAEVMVSAEIKEILIANQIVDSTKISRLLELNRQADIMVSVDNLQRHCVSLELNAPRKILGSILEESCLV